MNDKTRFEDPDFGIVEVPADRFPTREEMDARRAKLAQTLTQRLWPKGTVFRCPSCDRRSLVGRDDLVEDVVRPGQVQTFRHMRGAKCSACSAQFLEPAEIVAIENEVGVELVPDFEAKVSNIGSGTLGTYWPKDVVRNMRLTPEKKAFIRVLDHDTALVRFAPRGPKTERAAGRKRAKRNK